MNTVFLNVDLENPQSAIDLINRLSLNYSDVPTLTTPAPQAETHAPQTETPAPTVNVGAGGVELDNNGIPWDERIHGKAKEPKTAQGFWKRRKGISDQFYNETLNALIAQWAGNTPAPQTTAPAPQTTAPAPQTTAPAPQTTAPAPQTAPTPPAPQVQAPVAPETKYLLDGDQWTYGQLQQSGWTDEMIKTLNIAEIIYFPKLITTIDNALAAGTITNQTIDAVLAEHGIATRELLAANPTATEQVYHRLFSN